MLNTGNLKVSSRGQMSLPAAARHSWGLDEGGEVGYLHLGDALLMIPGSIERLRSELLDAISDEVWEMAAAGFGDPELASE